MKIYLLRHGETDYNKQKMLQGRTDIPLNATGEQQARRAADKLKKISFDAVYTSPLQRAVRTGELATGLDPDSFIRDERIREIAFGEAESKPMNTLWEGFDYFFKAPEKYVASRGAETFESLQGRVAAFLTDVSQMNYERVLVLSHGAAIHSMLQYIGGYELKDFWSVEVGNCSISEVEYRNDKFSLIQIDNF